MVSPANPHSQSIHNMNSNASDPPHRTVRISSIPINVTVPRTAAAMRHPMPLSFVAYLNKLTTSPPYDLAFFFIICIDIAIQCYETDSLVSTKQSFITPTTLFSTISLSQQLIIHVAYLGILAFYMVDIVARIYSAWCINTAPMSKWFRNLYNVLDVVVVIVYLVEWTTRISVPASSSFTFMRVLRALRILRVFRVIPSIRSLQVVVDALLGTLCTNVMDLLILLFLIILVFGVIAHFLFSPTTTIVSEEYAQNSASYYDWNTLPQTILTLWVYVCADGWTTYQNHIIQDGYFLSEIFTVSFIFVGNFIIANLFIAVICQNVDEASRAARQLKIQRRREAKKAKRELFLRKQRRDMMHLVAQKSKTDSDFQSIVKDLVGSLRHDEFIPTRHLVFNLTWLETFVVTLHYHENTMFRCQQCLFAMAHALGEYVDKRLSSKQQL